jgi:aminotransferase
MKPLSEAVLSVPPSGIRRFFDIVAEMDDVISLGVGEPDYVTPWRVREAAIYSLEKGFTNYTSNYGLLELRREIARMLHDRYGLGVRSGAPGSDHGRRLEALDTAFRALLNPGDEVLVPEPCYVSVHGLRALSPAAAPCPCPRAPKTASASGPKMFNRA